MPALRRAVADLLRAEKDLPADAEREVAITVGGMPKVRMAIAMGRKWTLHCYEEAVKEKYRFFSFGDAMFIYGKYDYSHNLED